MSWQIIFVATVVCFCIIKVVVSLGKNTFDLITRNFSFLPNVRYFTIYFSKTETVNYHLIAHLELL